MTQEIVQRDPMEFNSRGLVPKTSDDLKRLADMAVAAGYAPKGVNSAQAFVAMAHGATIGLTPWQAVQSIAVINGRPAMWGDAPLALVRASGTLEDMRETFRNLAEDGDVTDKTVAVCEVRRKGEDSTHVIEFGVGDAKRAKLWGKPGPWQTSPKRMLQLRARGFALRDKFPDALGGISIGEEYADTPNSVPHFNPDNMRTKRERLDSALSDEPIETEAVEVTAEEATAADDAALFGESE